MARAAHGQGMRGWRLPVVALALASLMPLACRAQPAAQTPDIAVSGPPQTVFDWQRDACEPPHVPDAPTRAWRDDKGTVRLLLSHNVNRALTGPDFEHLAVDCSPLLTSRRKSDIAAFDDLHWISGVFTRDGHRVYALAHTEQRGNRTPGLCPADTYPACLLNAVTALVSTDGGRSFVPATTGRPPVVATLPYPYPTDRDTRVGYANPTNILALGGHYYAFVFADGYRAQKRGLCLLRNADPADPGGWRAWNGRDFSSRFVDPFRKRVTDPADHVCEPVAQGQIGRMFGSISLHRSTGQVVAIFGDRRPDAQGRMVEGFYASASRDLIAWSEPRLVMQGELLWDRDCGQGEAMFYPSLIDHQSTSLSFEDVGHSAWLYFVRYDLDRCRVTWDRNLVRVPVTIR